MSRLSAKRRSFLSQVVIVGFLTLGAAAFFMPFLWMVSVSFDQMANVSVPFPPQWIPKNPGLFNYMVTFTNSPMLKFFLNSTIVTVATTFLRLCICTLAGYAFAKGNFPGKRVLLLVILSSMMIPMEVTILPLYMLFRKLHILNTYVGIVLPSLVYAFGVFLSSQFYKSIPDDLIHSARIDGYGEGRIWFRIMLPLSKPIMSTLAILSFMDSWNDFMWPLIVVSKLEKYTVVLGLTRLVGSDSGANIVGTAMAATVVSVIPIIALYLSLQRFYVQGIAMTGIKG